jgi:O-antigen/teichoic acid export membrane protein
MHKVSFFRHAAVYGLASLLLQAAGLVLLPLYTRHLSPGDFGLLEVLGRTAEVLTTCLFVGGVRQALVALHQQAEGEHERRQVAGAALVVMMAVCLAGGGLMLVLARPLSTLLDAGGPGLLLLATASVLLEIFWLVPLTLVQARVESGTYLVATVSQFLVRVALSVVMVAWCGLGVAGVLGAMALTSGLYAVVVTGRELLWSAAWPDLRRVRDLLAFALPFLPGGLCFFAINYGDRFFLLHWQGREEVGTYSLGYKLALAVGTLSLNPLQMVWGVQMYREARAPEAPAIFGRAFSRILAAYVLVGLGLCLFQDEVVAVLGGPAYAGAAAIIAPVVLAGLFQTTAALMDAGLYVCGRTGLKLGLTALATVVTLTFYVLLIPSHGSMGAALATVAGFAVLAIGTWRVTQHVFPVAYEWGRVSGMMALAVGLWLLSRMLPPTAWAAPMKMSLGLLWPVLLWQLGLVSNEEKQYLRALLGEVGTRLTPWRVSHGAGANGCPLTPTAQPDLANTR